MLIYFVGLGLMERSTAFEVYFGGGPVLRREYMKDLGKLFDKLANKHTGFLAAPYGTAFTSVCLGAFVGPYIARLPLGYRHSMGSFTPSVSCPVEQGFLGLVVE